MSFHSSGNRSREKSDFPKWHSIYRIKTLAQSPSLPWVSWSLIVFFHLKHLSWYLFLLSPFLHWSSLLTSSVVSGQNLVSPSCPAFTSLNSRLLRTQWNGPGRSICYTAETLNAEKICWLVNFFFFSFLSFSLFCWKNVKLQTFNKQTDEYIKDLSIKQQVLSPI